MSENDPVNSTAYNEDPYEASDDPSAEFADEQPSAEEDSWLDEGLITLTVLAGLVLFLIPEPATSGVGLVLMLFGGLAWLVDVAT